MTTLVKVLPPAKLTTLFERLATKVEGENETLARFLRGFAKGGHGSGFIAVRSEGGQTYEFVVTNRHVISQAETADIEFTDHQSFKGAEIIYAHPTYDVAVLAFPGGQKPSPYGLRPGATAAADRQVVIATGFPGLGGMPSFQTTDGKVSNALFEMPDSDDRKILYIQHTAPIDPGSSGGPLTNEAGEFVGINTLVARDRHSTFFAVPAEYVAEAVKTATEIVIKRNDQAWMKAKLINACKVITGELMSESPKVNIVDDYISNQMVAEQGPQAYSGVAARDPRISRAFVHDPMDAMRTAIVITLFYKIKKEGGGIATSNTCEKINASDEPNIGKHGKTRMIIDLQSGPVELAWTFEHGFWRLATANLKL